MRIAYFRETMRIRAQKIRDPMPRIVSGNQRSRR